MQLPALVMIHTKIILHNIVIYLFFNDLHLTQKSNTGETVQYLLISNQVTLPICVKIIYIILMLSEKTAVYYCL